MKDVGFQTNSRQVILLLTHFYDDSLIAKKYEQIKKCIDGRKYDIYLILHSDIYDIDVSTCNIIRYSTSSLLSLGYTPITNRILPGSCHYPLLKFYREHNQYSFYWIVEYDVHFTSKWNMLFDAFYDYDYDFISSHVEKYNLEKNGRWHWWNNCNNSGFELGSSIKSFNPIYRCSNRALSLSNDYLLHGYSAHAEVLLASLFYNNGLGIADFGGSGEFVIPKYKNYFYHEAEGINNGTMRYRPLYKISDIDNSPHLLYHPVKYFEP